MPADPVLAFHNNSWSSEIPNNPYASYHWRRQLHIMLPICALQKSHKQGLYDSDVKGSNFETGKTYGTPGQPTSTSLRSCSFFCQQLLLLCIRHLHRFLLKVLCDSSFMKKVRYDYHYFTKKTPQRPWLYPWIQHLKTKWVLKWLRRLESVSKKMCVHNLHRWWNTFFCIGELVSSVVSKDGAYSADNYFTSTPTPILWRYGHLAHLDPANWRSVSAAQLRLTRMARHVMS